MQNKMKQRLRKILFLFMLVASAGMLHAQGMKMGEVIIISNSAIQKGVKPEALQNWINDEVASSWTRKYPGTSMHLFLADRGDSKGKFLLVTSVVRAAYREVLPAGSPFAEDVFAEANANIKSSADFLRNPDAYTEYSLIGPEHFKSLPVAGILGIHYIKVKPERSAEFEKLVVDKLHPSVGQLFPDMQLLYYKAVAGDHKGEYITIFTIKSAAARDKYWPAGAPETETLKKGFDPLKKLAVELGDYLVEGSYLKPESGGAAAYFESVKWTDFVYSK
jgi:hypothetical protein